MKVIKTNNFINLDYDCAVLTAEDCKTLLIFSIESLRNCSVIECFKMFGDYSYCLVIRRHRWLMLSPFAEFEIRFIENEVLPQLFAIDKNGKAHFIAWLSKIDECFKMVMRDTFYLS